MTVAQLMPQVRAAVPAPSQRTYLSALRLLEHELGDVRIDAVTPAQLRLLRDAVESRTGQDIVDRARRRQRALASYDPRAHGQGAAGNLVMAARFFFRFAMDAGLLERSPAAQVNPPARHPSLRRPLTSDELAEVWLVASTTGMDPALDTHLLTFLRHTGCRRSGVLGLTRDAMDRSRGQVRLTEKYGHTRVLPLSRRIIEGLDDFALDRGAVAGHDAVFRYRNGNPLTRRRFNSLFDRVDRHTTFTEALDVSAHWIRHTTLADIAAASDMRVAAAFAGHAPGELGVIGTYTLVTFDDLCDAYEAVFGAR